MVFNSIGYDGDLTYGGYGQNIVVKENFVVRIPDKLELDAASPLLCAGITTYSPLKHWKAGLGKKVAIVGMGGLGHIAVQFAHAMGAEVTVLNQTMNKKTESLEMGANHYYATNDPATFTDLTGRFDLILNTVSANLNVDAVLSLVRVDLFTLKIAPWRKSWFRISPSEPMSNKGASEWAGPVSEDDDNRLCK